MFHIMAEGVGDYSREGDYQSVGVYSKKCGVWEDRAYAVLGIPVTQSNLCYDSLVQFSRFKHKSDDERYGQTIQDCSITQEGRSGIGIARSATAQVAKSVTKWTINSFVYVSCQGKLNA